MSRARELAKVGGLNQQVISGLSTHVGISTFAADVIMYEDLTVNGNTAVGGNLTVTGTTTFNGGTLTLGDAATDNVVFGGDVNSNIIPNTDNAYDLGSSSQEWKDLYVDGTANIDSLVADTADINGGTADNVVIGGSTAAAGSFTTVAASSNLTVSGNGSVTGTFDVDGATTLDGLTVAEAATFSNNVAVTGTLDVDGATTLDGLTVAEGATFSTTLGVTGTTTLAGQLDANGDVNLGNATTDSVTVTGRFDSDLLPIADGTSDLGSSTLEWQDLYIDGTANIDSLVADTADINGGTIDGTVIGGNSATTGAFTALTASGNVDLGDSTSDTITATGRFDSDLVPSSDNARDLGTSALEWKDLYLDGTANIDSLVADTADINGGTADNVVIGGSTAAAGSFTTVAASSNATITGNLDVDGDTTLDTTDVAGTLTVVGSAVVDNVTVNGNTVSTSSGGLTLDSTSGTTTVADALNVTGGTTTTALNANGDVNLGDATSDTITCTGRFDAALVPASDNAIDLGTSSLEYKDLYLDGTANIDSLVADTADINGGTADNVVIGGSTAAAGSFTTVAASSNVTVTGAIDVDGHSNLDNVSIAGVSTFTGATTFTGAIDANGGATVDNIQIGVSNDNEIDTASGNLVIDSAGGTTTVDDNLTVSGNLTVNGTTTTINSTTVAIDDKNFQVATGAADDAAADGAGLTVDSGDGDKTWNFEATGDNWGSNQNINAASGKVYKINNTSVLSATTLGSGVVNSSLTTLGTISTGVWQGTAIANGYLANSTVSYGGVSLSLGGSDGTPAFDLSDATNYPTSSLSGTITNAQLAGSIANSKLSTISTANKVSLSALNIDGGTDIGAALADADLFIVDDGGGGTNRSITASAVKTYMGATGGAFSVANLDIDGATDIGAALVDADEFIVDDGGGGTNRRSDMSRVKTYIYGAMSGDATAGSGGAVTLANSGVSAGTVGSSTAIPIITVDAKGRITNTSTTAVDSTTIEQGNSSVAVTDSGTGSIVATIDGSTLATFAAAGITLSSGAFVGNVTGNVTGNTSGSSGSCTGNAATATALANARTIGGVSFDGTANINLPGVNTSGTQDTSGNADTATLATNSTITANNSNNETVYPVFVDGATGTQGLESDTGFTYNPSSGTLTSSVFVGALTGNVTGNTSGSSGSCTGNAATATILATARTIAGVSFDGSANISLNNNAITNGAGYVTSSGWTSSNDGSGSGLDADLLDGVQGSSYLRSDTSDTFTGTLTVSGNILPNANGTRDLGASGTRWANVYSSDLDLSNEAKGGNTVDGSWGSYLIEEGENDLFLKNRRTGKQYKFVLQEV